MRDMQPDKFVRIIRVHKNESKDLPIRAYLSRGFMNTNLENSLQKLIEYHPQVLSGELDPPRFFMLKSEISC